MDLTRLGALTASGAGGASLATGSVFSGSGVSLMSVEGPTHRSVSVPPGKEFQNVDLSCAQKFYVFSVGGIFPYLRDSEKIRAQVSGLETKDYKLEAPQSITGTIKGCLKATFSQVEEGGQKKTVGVTMEMAMSRDERYGILLMNTIANLKDGQEKKSSIFRAIFLEKNGRWWEAKGGAQWSDDAFLKDANKLKWEGLGRSEEIDLQKSYEPATSLQKESISFTWQRDNASGNNMFQHLAITADPSATTKPPHDFWNKKEDPLDTNSKILKEPEAVFMNGVWAKSSSGSDIKAKEWFDLFRPSRGNWAKD